MAMPCAGFSAALLAGISTQWKTQLEKSGILLEKVGSPFHLVLDLKSPRDVAGFARLCTALISEIQLISVEQLVASKR